jgi:protein O-GlcNAc transferase
MRRERDLGTLVEAARRAFKREKYAEAVRHLQRAASLSPSSFGVHLNLGTALHHAGRVDDALAAFGRAETLAPEVADVHIGYGGALVRAGRLREAETRYREAIRLKPLSVDAHYNLAKVLFQVQDFEHALPAWAYVLHREPGSFDALFRTAVCRQELCNWRDYATHLETLCAALNGGNSTNGTAFFSLWPWDDCDLHKRAAEAEARFHGVAESSAVHRRPIKRGPVIRLAYVGADFRNHPVARLIAGLLEHHDRSRFETIAVALNKDDGSLERRRLEKAADTFFDVHDVKDDRLVAKRLRDRGVHIAIDLMGYTGQSRIGIFGHRAVPIQVTYMGFPGTLCAPAIDYMIADPFVASAGVRRTATEKIVILPHCYQCNDRSRGVPITPPRSVYGLPEGAFIFASFNHQAKITPQVFGAWMSILRQVDGSVLWLVANSSEARRNLCAEAERRGIASSRLVFADRVGFDDYMERFTVADLHLDTHPYTGHATGSDGLWAGCPTVTLAGDGFPSRVCGSLLTTIGVPELIARDWEEYEGIAIRLARDREELGRVKVRIAQGRETSPLFDMATFCRHIERAYEEMMTIAESGGLPREIDVRRLI